MKLLLTLTLFTLTLLGAACLRKTSPLPTQPSVPVQTRPKLEFPDNLEEAFQDLELLDDIE